MKKAISIVLGTALILGLTACGEPKVVDNGGTAASEKTETEASETAETEETTETATVTETEKSKDKSDYRTSSEGVTVEASQGSGIYAEGFDLELTSTDGATIYYTTDGSDPMMSDTAMTYSSAIPVADRSGEANVVSAVDPQLFSGNYVNVNSTGDGFDCYVNAPSDDAVDKIVTLRAVACDADGVYGPETTLCYFLGTMEEHIEGIAESCAASGQDLAVISIDIDYDDLFDYDTGIYVLGSSFEQALNAYLKQNKLDNADTARRLLANYKQKGLEWEREVGMTMLECNADGTSVVLNQNCGIRIQGNYSRSDLQKGFRLFARSEYGLNNFNYAFFGEDYTNEAGETMDKFKSIILRNGGNCAFTCKFNSDYWQSMLNDLDCATQKSRPCILYINGEYWGLYVMEEDYSNDYFADKYGVTKDQVVVYKGDAEALELGYQLDEGLLPEGETDQSYYFYDLLDFFKTHDNCESEEDYNALCELVDPQSVMDYFAVQCWINNKWDWPGKNWSMWRTMEDDGTEYGDGRFRFCFYDLEFGGVSGESDAKTNTVKEDNYKTYGLLDTDTTNPAVLCFAYLMTNREFRVAFCDELLSLSDGILEKEAALEQLTVFENTYGPLLDQFFERYPDTGSAEEALNGGYASSACIRSFLNIRYALVDRQVKWIYKHFGETYTEE